VTDKTYSEANPQLHRTSNVTDKTYSEANPQLRFSAEFAQISIIKITALLTQTPFVMPVGICMSNCTAIRVYL